MPARVHPEQGRVIRVELTNTIKYQNIPDLIVSINKNALLSTKVLMRRLMLMKQLKSISFFYDLCHLSAAEDKKEFLIMFHEDYESNHSNS